MEIIFLDDGECPFLGVFLKDEVKTVSSEVGSALIERGIAKAKTFDTTIITEDEYNG